MSGFIYYGNGGAANSGDSLNIEVIGSLTQPTNPKQYTIWVKTDVAIPTWEMGLSDNISWSMAAGFVYFVTSIGVYDRVTTYNPSKENYIFLTYNKVWQNQGTATDYNWVQLESYLYNNGSWVQMSSTTMIPSFTYTGSYKIVDDNDNEVSTSINNWRIKFLTSGTLSFAALNGASNGIDVFCVGGGGGGGAVYGKDISGEGYFASGGGGGGGGYTTTATGISIAANTSYTITIGSGGNAGNAGGTTSAFGVSAVGGSAGNNATYANVPGTGGAGGCNGGTGGSYNTTSSVTPGTDGSPGQGSTTTAFASGSGTKYSGGGGGGQGFNNYGNLNSAYVSGGADTGGASHGNAAANGGGGGGGGSCLSSNSAGKVAAGAGGSGIVIIRNKR